MLRMKQESQSPVFSLGMRTVNSRADTTLRQKLEWTHTNTLWKEYCTGDQPEDLDLLHTETVFLTDGDWVPHCFFSRMLMGKRMAQMRNWYLYKACAILTAPQLVGLQERSRERGCSWQKKELVSLALVANEKMPRDLKNDYQSSVKDCTSFCNSALKTLKSM